MATIQSYGFDIDVAAVPEAVISIVLKDALDHKLGNECSSAVVNLANKDGAEGRDAVGAWREANKAAVEKFVAEYRDKVIAALYDGTLFVKSGRGGPRGPRIDPVEKEYRRLVDKEVAAWLKSGKRTMPKKADELMEFATPRGPEVYTLNDLRQKIINAPKFAGLRADAEKNVKAAEREAAKKAAGYAETVDPMALGE